MVPMNASVYSSHLGVAKLRCVSCLRSTGSGGRGQAVGKAALRRLPAVSSRGLVQARPASAPSHLPGQLLGLPVEAHIDAQAANLQQRRRGRGQRRGQGGGSSPAQEIQIRRCSTRPASIHGSPASKGIQALPRACGPRAALCYVSALLPHRAQEREAPVEGWPGEGEGRRQADQVLRDDHAGDLQAGGAQGGRG